MNYGAHHDQTTGAKNILDEFVNSVYVIDVDNNIKQKTIEVRRLSRLKLPDSIIAASALIHGLPFLSADKGFQKVSDLDLIYYEKPQL